MSQSPLWLRSYHVGEYFSAHFATTRYKKGFASLDLWRRIQNNGASFELPFWRFKRSFTSASQPWRCCRSWRWWELVCVIVTKEEKTCRKAYTVHTMQVLTKALGSWCFVWTKRLSLSWTTTHEWVHTASEMGYYTVQPGLIQHPQWIVGFKRLTFWWTTTHEWVHTTSKVGSYSVQTESIQHPQWIDAAFKVDCYNVESGRTTRSSLQWNHGYAQNWGRCRTSAHQAYQDEDFSLKISVCDPKDCQSL